MAASPISKIDTIIFFPLMSALPLLSFSIFLPCNAHWISILLSKIVIERYYWDGSVDVAQLCMLANHGGKSPELELQHPVSEAC